MRSISGTVVRVGYRRSETGHSIEHYALVDVLISRSRREEDKERRLTELRDALLRKQVSIFPLVEPPPKEKGLTEYLEAPS